MWPQSLLWMLLSFFCCCCFFYILLRRYLFLLINLAACRTVPCCQCGQRVRQRQRERVRERERRNINRTSQKVERATFEFLWNSKISLKCSASLSFFKCVCVRERKSECERERKKKPLNIKGSKSTRIRQQQQQQQQRGQESVTIASQRRRIILFIVVRGFFSHSSLSLPCLSPLSLTFRAATQPNSNFAETRYKFIENLNSSRGRVFKGVLSSRSRGGYANFVYAEFKKKKKHFLLAYLRCGCQLLFVFLSLSLLLPFSLYMRFFACILIRVRGKLEICFRNSNPCGISITRTFPQTAGNSCNYGKSRMKC